MHIRLTLDDLYQILGPEVSVSGKHVYRRAAQVPMTTMKRFPLHALGAVFSRTTGENPPNLCVSFVILVPGDAANFKLCRGGPGAIRPLP